MLLQLRECLLIMIYCLAVAIVFGFVVTLFWFIVTLCKTFLKNFKRNQCKHLFQTTTGFAGAPVECNDCGKILNR